MIMQQDATLLIWRSVVDMYYSLNFLKGGYIGDNIGDYYRAY